MGDWVKKIVNTPFGLNNLKGLRGLGLFVVIITVFHLLYKYFELEIIELPFIVSIVDWLIKMLLISCSWVLNHIFGIQNIISGDLLVLPNQFKIQMLPGCSGFQQFFLVIILLILYPGPWKHKLWFIPLGVIIIHILNLSRFVFIAIYSSWFPAHFHFVHDWIFRPFIYAGIFALWLLG